MKQLYLDNGYMILNGSRCFVVSPLELEVLDNCAKEYTPERMTQRDLIMAFPEARKYLKERIKQIKTEITKLNGPDNRWEYKQFIHTYFKEVRDTRMEEIINDLVEKIYITIPVQKLEDELRQRENMLYLMTAKEKLGSGEILADHIAQAKQVPISNFIEFNRAGFAKCPFHAEKTGSFKYYKKDNHAHCFACNKSADVIDLVMHQYSLKFLDAVKFILNK